MGLNDRLCSGPEAAQLDAEAHEDGRRGGRRRVRRLRPDLRAPRRRQQEGALRELLADATSSRSRLERLCATVDTIVP